MGYTIKQSQTARPLVFKMYLAGTKTAATGLSPTVALSKNGAAFGSPSGAVSEVANGWYKVAGNATDSNTLGPLALYATAATADPTDELYEVVAYDPTDAVRLGLADILATVVPGSYAAGTAGFDIGQTYSRLSSVSINLVSPIATDGTTINIIRGDDYRNQDSRAISFTDAGGTWPDLTGGTVRLITYPPSGSGLNVAGTVPNPGTTNQVAHFDLTAAQTTSMPLGGYPYHCTATLSNGDVITLVEGEVIVT